mgnify:CR=1 FL=1
MLVLGLLLNIAGIGLFCWLIFTLAVFALPFFVGLNVFMMALHSGAGIFGAAIAGIATSGVTLAIGQTAFAMTRSVIIRAIIAALFACFLSHIPQHFGEGFLLGACNFFVKSVHNSDS